MRRPWQFPSGATPRPPAARIRLPDTAPSISLKWTGWRAYVLHHRHTHLRPKRTLPKTPVRHPDPGPGSRQARKPRAVNAIPTRYERLCRMARTSPVQPPPTPAPAGMTSPSLSSSQEGTKPQHHVVSAPISALNGNSYPPTSTVFNPIYGEVKTPAGRMELRFASLRGRINDCTIS